MSPQKKMKKRKELNALIGLSDTRRKSKQSSGHRLLRTGTDTGTESESESVESSQKLSSHEILKLSEDLKDKQTKLDELESGDRGLAKLWSSLSEINQKLSALDSAVNHLKTNIKSSSDLIALPRTIEELQKSVASIGSTVTSVQHDVSLIQSVVEERRTEESQLKDSGCELIYNGFLLISDHAGLKNGEKPVNSSSCVTLKQELQRLEDGVKDLNSSVLLQESRSSEQIQSVRFVLSDLSKRLSALDQSQSRDTQPAAAETLQSPADTGTSPSRRPSSLSRRRYKRGLTPGAESERVDELQRGGWSLSSEEQKEALDSAEVSPDSLTH
ncbi:hypothetical protein cypCar_00037502 [Cyprinus carpio]|nr:hypothetical protein cypCar_00037502 [Cyprinus carpio]